jgi:hypothetical protein
LFDGQHFHDVLLRNIDYVHAVAIANGDHNVFSVRGYGTLVGTPRYLYGCDGLLGRSVDYSERVVALHGGE